MYDMYSWHEDAAAADEHAKPANGAKPAEPVQPPEPAVRAVQVALDRRDNGGDADPVQPR